jgi:two-component system, LytTR family, response regulator
MKAMIIEDSRLAKQELKELLLQHPQIDICAEASNARDALPIIQHERPELLFLDINMPGKNGFELLEMLDYEPQVIFITAYADQAIQSFNFNTIDYLLKPVSPERLRKSLIKIKSNEITTPPEAEPPALEPNSQIMLRDNDKCFWVKLQDIHYFESCGNYTQVFWGQTKVTLLRAIGKIEQRLPASHFFRANRQQIVNITEVTHVDTWVNGGYQLHLKSGSTLEISRRHAARFRQLFSL